MRLIDADAFKKWLLENSINEREERESRQIGIWIDAFPSTQPERKKGKWTIKTGELAIWDVCSECKKMVMHKAPFYNYCPNCGADMRGEQDED